MSNLIQENREASGIINIFVTRTIGAWAIVSGILIICSGKERWSGHAYDELNHMPGSPYTWGALFLIAGILVVVGSMMKVKVSRFSVRNAGLWLIAFWCILFVIGFIASMLVNPGVSLNIPTTYLFVGILSLFMTKSRYTP